MDYYDIDWIALEMNRDYSVHDLNKVVEIAPKYYILDSLADYEDYSISFKGFLPTVVDITYCAVFSHSVVSDSLQPHEL